MKDDFMTGDEWYEDTEITRIREYNITVKKTAKRDLPWIVLLHGFPTCSYDWYKLWPLLSKEYNLIAFDFLGFGRSDKPYPHRYNIIEQAEITLQVLAIHKITSCYIIAHDYAVSVTQEILSRLEDNRSNLHIKKLIFLNGGLFPEMHRPILIQKLLLSPAGGLVNSFVTKGSLSSNFSKIFGPSTQLDDREIDELWALIKYNKGKRVFRLLIKYILDRKENRDRWVKHMQSTNVSMKLVNGPEDPISGRHLVAHYQELIPNADTEVLEGIGHYPNIEAPERLAEIVKTYFV